MLYDILDYEFLSDPNPNRYPKKSEKFKILKGTHTKHNNMYLNTCNNYLLHE